MSILKKFLFRTFFYHPEIPSSLYGATDDLWGLHGARFILQAPFCGGGGGGGGGIYGFDVLPPHTPPLEKHLSGIYIYIYIGLAQQPERYAGLASLADFFCRGIFRPRPAKGSKISIFSKFLFRTFFYHPEIPSSLYGATDDLWGLHGAHLILIAPFCGWVGGGGGGGGWGWVEL